MQNQEKIYWVSNQQVANSGTETREYMKACKNVEMFLDMNKEAEGHQQRKEKQKNKKEPLL